MILLQIYHWICLWKFFLKSVNIWGCYGQEFSVLFFLTQCCLRVISSKIIAWPLALCVKWLLNMAVYFRRYYFPGGVFLSQPWSGWLASFTCSRCSFQWTTKRCIFLCNAFASLTKVETFKVISVRFTSLVRQLPKHASDRFSYTVMLLASPLLGGSSSSVS